MYRSVGVHSNWSHVLYSMYDEKINMRNSHAGINAPLYCIKVSTIALLLFESLPLSYGIPASGTDPGDKSSSK